MLGGGDPVGVDRLDVPRVRLSAPARAGSARRSTRVVELGLRARAAARRPRADWATNDSAAAEAAREVVARLLVADVDQLAESPSRRRAARAPPAGRRARRRVRTGSALRLGRAAGPGSKAPSTSRPQTLLEGDRADEVLDVDAAVAQRAAVAVGLGDLGGEGDDALETRLDFAHLAHFRSTVTRRKPCSNALPIRSAAR